MRGGYGEREFYEIFVFRLSAFEPAEEMRDKRGREWACVAIHGRMGGRLRCFHILLSLRLISELSAVIVSKQLDERKSPTLSCELAMKTFCVTLGVSLSSRHLAVRPLPFTRTASSSLSSVAKSQETRF